MTEIAALMSKDHDRLDAIFADFRKSGGFGFEHGQGARVIEFNEIPFAAAFHRHRAVDASTTRRPARLRPKWPPGHQGNVTVNGRDEGSVRVVHIRIGPSRVMHKAHEVPGIKPKSTRYRLARA